MPGRSMGERLAVDPNDTNVLYLGARSGNGLWRSQDSGATWSQVDSFPSAGDYFQDSTNDYTQDLVGVVWVTFDELGRLEPDHSHCRRDAHPNDKTIGISSDGGQTWSNAGVPDAKAQAAALPWVQMPSSSSGRPT